MNDKGPQNLSLLSEKLLAQNYYERLNVTQNATLKEIKKSYYNLSFQYHPDKNNDPAAKSVFALIHDAYETLSDEHLKCVYDNLLRNGLGSHIPRQSEYKQARSFKFHHEDKSIQEIHNIAISNNYIAIPQSGKGIHVLNNRTGLYYKLFTNGPGGYHYHVMISEEENKLYATSSQGDLEVYCMEKGTLLQTYKGVYKFASATSSVIHVNNKKKIIYDRDRIAEFFTDGSVNNIYINGINHASVSSDGKLACVATGQGGIYVVNITNRKITKTFTLGFPAYCAEISADGKWVACGGVSDNKTVMLYHIETGKFKKINTASTQVHSINFSPNGKFMIIGEHTSGYAIYSLEEDKIVHREYVQGYIKNVFVTNNNRIIVNAYDHVYNMPIPSELVLNSHALGMEVQFPAIENIKDSSANGLLEEATNLTTIVTTHSVISSASEGLSRRSLVANSAPRDDSEGEQLPTILDSSLTHDSPAKASGPLQFPSNLRITPSSKLKQSLDTLSSLLQEDNAENRAIATATQTLLDETLGQFVKFSDSSGNDASTIDENKIIDPIATYRENVSNLSTNQKIVIAISTFLGILVGFIIGVLAGSLATGLNPIGALMGGATGAVVGASIGATAGGGVAFGLSHFGVFKYDPIKARARELVDEIENTVKTRDCITK